jgi:hypothetical protein
MKTGIVFFQESQNLGDDIQTYAASQLVPNPVFIEREQLNKIETPGKAIISGWFMHNPENFPPSDKINPLFISFHGKSSVINDTHYSYFKKHEPIGCRDYNTLKLFQSIGIKAYFSGCATLTLNPPETVEDRTEEIIIVDLLRNNYTASYRNFVKANLIPEELKDKVSYFSHSMPDLPSKGIDDRMELVKNVLMRYSKAKLVITSLIHCALPCIAMGTPVVFVDFGFDKNDLKRDRFKGIIDMMNIYDKIEAPLSNRNVIHTTLRVLHFHKLLKHKVKPLPLSLFNTNEHHNSLDSKLRDTLKLRVSEFINPQTS